MGAIIPGALGAISGIVKGIQGIKQNKLANQITVPEATYTTSPYAQAMLNTANQMKNGRMAGAASAENKIAANGANAMGSVERNATSGSQALSMIGGIQGNTNDADDGLQQREGQYNLSMLNNQNNANMAMTNEHDKVYQDMVRKQNQAIQQKSALRGAATQNLGGGMNDILNGGFATSNALLRQQNGNSQQTGNGTYINYQNGMGADTQLPQ